MPRLWFLLPSCPIPHPKKELELPLIMSKSIFKLFVLFVVDVLFDELPL